MSLQLQLADILDFSVNMISDMLPSEWAEQRMRITTGRFQGPLGYNRTPYFKDIADFFSNYNPYNEGALMGGAQLGKSKTVIEAAIAWLISERPCNIGFLTGHADLSMESMDLLDSAIDNSGLRSLIRKQSLKTRVSQTGDTRKLKEYPGGKLIAGSATNHKLLRQRDWEKVIADDIEAAKGASKESGSTVSLIRKRTASFGDKKKILWVSTPELKHTSIIEPLFLSGNQQRWDIPCQRCHRHIPLYWEASIPDCDDKAGIHWDYDRHTGKLDPKTVGYVCQLCGQFFNDKNKYQFLLDGHWDAKAEPTNPKMVSWHISGLYAAAGMDSWTDHVRAYLECHPKDQPVKQEEYKTFVNLTLGESFEAAAAETSALKIRQNRSNYLPWEVPEKLSLSHGNGRIVLLTMAADMNGKKDDARLDWEIVAWPQQGGNYSVAHGSIGTFIPKEESLPVKKDRARWTYDFDKENNVWVELDKIRNRVFMTDTGRKMQIMFTGLDCGFFSAGHAYPYVDKNAYVIGLKGKWEEDYLKYNADIKYFYEAKERANLYLVTVGKIKDEVWRNMQLDWTDRDVVQPYGFMNFPHSADGMYEDPNYFSHFESEHCVVVSNKDGTDSSYRWEKKRSNVMNHMWDCRIYNHAVKEIFIHLVAKERKLPKLTWRELASSIAIEIEKTMAKV